MAIVNCPNCRLEINNKIYTKCPVCGTKLSNKTNNDEKADKKFYKKNKFWIKVFVCVILGIVSVFVPISQTLVGIPISISSILLLLLIIFFPITVIALLIIIIYLISKKK